MHSTRKIGIILQFIELTFSYCHSIFCVQMPRLASPPLSALKCHARIYLHEREKSLSGDDDDSIQKNGTTHNTVHFSYFYSACCGKRSSENENVLVQFQFFDVVYYYYEFSISPSLLVPLRNGSFPLFRLLLFLFRVAREEEEEMGMWNQFSGNGRVIVASNCEFFMLPKHRAEWEWTLSFLPEMHIFQDISQMSAEMVFEILKESLCAQERGDRPTENTEKKWMNFNSIEKREKVSPFELKSLKKCNLPEWNPSQLLRRTKKLAHSLKNLSNQQRTIEVEL